MFSGDREIQTRGSTVPVGNEACRVSHWNGGPEGWDIPVNTEHQWSILFLTYHHRILLRMTPSLCLNTEVSDVNERNKTFQQSQTILVPKCSFKRIPTLDIFIQLYTVEILNQCCTSQRHKGKKPTLSDNLERQTSRVAYLECSNAYLTGIDFADSDWWHSDDSIL